MCQFEHTSLMKQYCPPYHKFLPKITSHTKKKSKFKTISKNPLEVPSFLVFSQFDLCLNANSRFFLVQSSISTRACVVKLENVDSDLMLLLLLLKPISLFRVSFNSLSLLHIPSLSASHSLAFI